MTKQNQWADVYIEQSGVGLNSRDEANPLYKDFTLPLMVAPMDTVVSLDNFHLFTQQGLITCLPRLTDQKLFNISISDDKLLFVSVSLSQMNTMIENNNLVYPRILIDVANGNMPKLFETIQLAKNTFDNITIMAGNVGSINAFGTLQAAGADYIRVGIGSGSACNTAVHTGVFQYLPTLIKGCKSIQSTAKIVADGGFRTYSDIIKAIASGANYVMGGSIFNKCLESCGEKYRKTNILEPYKINDIEKINKFYDIGELYVQYRGMSTKNVQKKLGKNKLRHSEGASFLNKVEYNIQEWLYGSNNPEREDDIVGFVNVLQSAMSYTGSKTLVDFREVGVRNFKNL